MEMLSYGDNLNLSSLEVEIVRNNSAKGSNQSEARTKTFNFSTLTPPKLEAFNSSQVFAFTYITMSRSPASDPTLFTSSTPHASSKQSATHINLNSKVPPNETPHEKVARLREAARRAKLAQQSPWERVIANGRVWADRLHRATASSLIGLTGTFIGLTVRVAGAY